MRLDTKEQDNQASYPVTPLSPPLNREARETAHRWLARFAPLLEGFDDLGAEESRERLESLPDLRADGEAALQRLETQATQAELTLLETLRSSLAEVDAAEEELRRRLSVLAPGDPEGHVDLEEIQAKLAEKAAQREVGSWETTSGLLPPRLDLTTSQPNWGSGAMLGIFSLGWNAFTTIHAILFIGGFSRVLGPFALFFLLFYAIFWSIGLAMGWAAFLALCRENVIVEGRRLSLTRTLFGYNWKREYTLPAGARARLIEPTMKQQNDILRKDVGIRDESGREIRLASGRDAEEQERLVRKLNEYLAGGRA